MFDKLQGAEALFFMPMPCWLIPVSILRKAQRFDMMAM